MAKRTSTNAQAIPLLVLLVALFFAVAVSVYVTGKKQDLRNRAANAGPTLALVPTNKQAATGDTFSIGITLNTDTDTVSAVELHMTFDPTAIQVQSFTAGTALPVVLTPFSASNGNIAVTLGVQPTSPFKGSAIIGTLNIKTIRTKTSEISFASTTTVASLGKTTNALAGSSGSQITVPGANTPTPTPTTTPAKTPTPTPAQSGPTPTSAPAGTPAPTPTPQPNNFFGLFFPKASPTPAPIPRSSNRVSFNNLSGSVSPVPSPTPLPAVTGEETLGKPTSLLASIKEFLNVVLQVLTGKIRK